MTLTEMLDDIKNQLTSDPLVSSVVSAVLSPEARTLLADLVGALAKLEADHAAKAEAEKAAAVEAAKTAPPADPTAAEQ